MLLSIVAAQSQNATNVWVFGKEAGLNFSGGSPVPFALTSNPPFNTNEGSSSILNRSGQLAFYTDGTTVWNRNHVAMPNGSGLLGNPSSTQTALIVPRPVSNCERYYLFTLDAYEFAPSLTLRYSVVDMSLQGGLGNVTIKNVILKTGVAEKLAATADAAGSGFWVVAHGYTHPTSAANSKFYSYHIAGNGLLNTVPVISTVGSPHQSSLLTSNQPSAGQMKISPNRQLIACAVMAGFVEILHFNPGSGQVTGPATTFSAFNPPFGTSHFVYGLEFSPNSQLVYATTTLPPRLYQFRIFPPAGSLLANGVPGLDMGQLQLGPNNQIYVARSGNTHLGSIKAPNVFGGAVYTPNAVTLSPGSNSLLGLPTVIRGNVICQ